MNVNITAMSDWISVSGHAIQVKVMHAFQLRRAFSQGDEIGRKLELSIQF
jgi:hypothetical protein